MSTRNKPAGSRSRRSSKKAASPHRRKWKRPVEIVRDVLGKTKNAVLATGAIAGAIVAIATVVTMILPKESKPSPPVTSTVEASFKEAKIESNVLLAQYEYSNQPAALGSASDGLPPKAVGHSLTADMTPTSAQPHIVLAVSENSTTASVGSSTTNVGEEPGGNQGTSTERTSTEEIKEETPEEKQARLRKEREARGTSEETKKLEEVKRLEEVKKLEEARAREVFIRAQEEKKAKEKEKAKIRKEEQEEEKLSRIRRSRDPHSGGNKTGNATARYPAFAEPPPLPATSFQREGHAKVVVGTGAPTSEVNAVLRKVKALLDKDRVSFSTSGTAFDAEDPAFSDISTGPQGEDAPSSVPSQCNDGCGLRPTIDKAIADSSSNLAEAAREVAAAFTDSRVQLYEHKLQPVGVTVNYTVDFLGFGGQRMILEWTLCSKRTKRPLPKTWWRNVIVKQIVPSSNSIKTSGNFWAPIPPTRGDYYFRLRVFEGSSEPTHKETQQFH